MLVDKDAHQRETIIVTHLTGLQWRNRRGGGQGAEFPRDFWPGNFCWPIGKEWQGKKGKWCRKGKSKKERWKIENLKMEGGKVTKWGEDLFFFFTYQNHWNLFWVYQNGNFLTGKKAFHAGKKIRKNDFAPAPEKYSSCALVGLKFIFAHAWTNASNYWKCISKRDFPNKIQSTKRCIVILFTIPLIPCFP